MALPQNPVQSFLWGEGGAALTPEQIAQLRAIQMRKGSGATDTSPVGSWTQGAARIVDALGDVVQSRRLDKAEASNNDYNKTLLQSILGGGDTSSVPSPEAATQVGAGNPTAAAGPTPDISGLSDSQIYKGFIDTVKGSVTNPYGLAAVAATGKAESGYDPAKINASWADPSESGVQGTSGGLLSWRNERLSNLRNFAQANGEDPKNISPQMQAKFFLQEDPNLVAGLNNSKSVEEAQGLMNNAWKFAGYNRPGGEAARRLSTAQALLSSFQGQPQEVASNGYVDPQVTTAGRVEQAPLPPVDPMATQAPQQQAPQMQPQMDQVAAPAQMQQQAPIQAVPDTAQMAQQAAPQVSPQSQQVAQAILAQPQAAPQQQAPQAPAINKALVTILSDPRANESTKKIAAAIMQQQQARAQAQYEQQLKQSDPAYQTDLELKRAQLGQIGKPTPDALLGNQMAQDKFTFEKGEAAKTTDIKEYDFAKQQGYKGTFPEWQVDMKRAAANNTTINNGEGNKFYNTLDEKNATIFSNLSDAGIQGRSKLAQIDQLDKLLSSTDTGAMAVLKQRAGDFGINTEGLSDIQAASALLSKMIPAQREPGSGPVSDADLAGFKNSLPRMINQPGGNATIINTMRGLTQYQIDMGNIADQVANREITPAEGRQKIASLPNPLANFKPPAPGKEKEGWTSVPTDVPNAIIRRRN